MPDAGVLATVLLIAGLFLLVLEFFVPSFGLIGIIAGLCLLVSFWSAYQAWGGGRNPGFFWTYVLFLLCGVPGTIAFGFYMLQYSSIGKAVVLQPPKFSQTANPLQHLVGKHGLTQTLLTPGGMVLIDNVRYHAESVGMLIDPQSPIVVIDVRQNSLVVRPATDEPLHPAVTAMPLTADDAAELPAAKPAMAPAEPAPDQEPAALRVTVVKPPKNLEATADSQPATTTRPADRSPQPPAAGDQPNKLDFDIPEDYTA